MLAKAQLNGAPTGIPVLAHQTDEAAILDGRHAPYSETHASMFCIMSWTDVLRGSLALAAAVRPMKDFRFSVFQNTLAMLCFFTVFLPCFAVK